MISLYGFDIIVDWNDIQNKFGYNLLGKMLKKQGGEKWSTLMKQRI